MFLTLMWECEWVYQPFENCDTSLTLPNEMMAVTYIYSIYTGIYIIKGFVKFHTTVEGRQLADIQQLAL